MLCLPPHGKSLVFYFPVMIYFISGVAEYFITSNHVIVRLSYKIYNFFNLIRQYRNEIIVAK